MSRADRAHGPELALVDEADTMGAVPSSASGRYKPARPRALRDAVGGRDLGRVHVAVVHRVGQQEAARIHDDHRGDRGRVGHCRLIEGRNRLRRVELGGDVRCHPVRAPRGARSRSRGRAVRRSPPGRTCPVNARDAMHDLTDEVPEGEGVVAVRVPGIHSGSCEASTSTTRSQSHNPSSIGSRSAAMPAWWLSSWRT